MSERLYDVVVIGAGTAGRNAVRAALAEGASVALVEEGRWTTLCARSGCMPSKALLASARRAHDIATADRLGIEASGRASIPRVLERVRRLRDDLRSDARDDFPSGGVAFFEGRARFVSPRTIAVDGQRTVTGRAFVVATGGRIRIPDGFDGIDVHTHETLFDAEDLGPRVGVVGAGPIGLELGQGLAQLGAEVHLFDEQPALDPIDDPVIGRRWQERLRRDLTLHLGHRPVGHRTSDGVVIEAGDASVSVDTILVAAGQGPRVDDLGLAEVFGVDLDDPAVADETRRLEEHPVFLAGDVHGRPILHEAAWEGSVAGANAARWPEVRRTQRPTPLQTVFTTPQIVRVGPVTSGLTWGEAELGDQGRMRLDDTDEGLLRIGIDADERVVAATFLATSAEHLGHLVAWAIETRATARELLRRPVYHPTLEEGLVTALRNARAALHRSPETS